MSLAFAGLRPPWRNGWSPVAVLAGKGPDVLTSNACMLLSKREISLAGFDPNFATNFVGPFLLTSLLTAKLQLRYRGLSKSHRAARMPRRGYGTKWETLRSQQARYRET